MIKVENTDLYLEIDGEVFNAGCLSSLSPSADTYNSEDRQALGALFAVPEPTDITLGSTSFTMPFSGKTRALAKIQAARTKFKFSIGLGDILPNRIGTPDAYSGAFTDDNSAFRTFIRCAGWIKSIGETYDEGVLMAQIDVAHTALRQIKEPELVWVLGTNVSNEAITDLEDVFVEVDRGWPFD